MLIQLAKNSEWRARRRSKFLSWNIKLSLMRMLNQELRPHDGDIFNFIFSGADYHVALVQTTTLQKFLTMIFVISLLTTHIFHLWVQFQKKWELLFFNYLKTEKLDSQNTLFWHCQNTITLSKNELFSSFRWGPATICETLSVINAFNAMWLRFLNVLLNLIPTARNWMNH